MANNNQQRHSKSNNNNNSHTTIDGEIAIHNTRKRARKDKGKGESYINKQVCSSQKTNFQIVKQQSTTPPTRQIEIRTRSYCIGEHDTRNNGSKRQKTKEDLPGKATTRTPSYLVNFVCVQIRSLLLSHFGTSVSTDDSFVLLCC